MSVDLQGAIQVEITWQSADIANIPTELTELVAKWVKWAEDQLTTSRDLPTDEAGKEMDKWHPKPKNKKENKKENKKRRPPPF